MKKRVLVVSFTNQAVDNVLLRLKESGFEQFVRVTSNGSTKVNEKLKEKIKTTGDFTTMD